jgi:hypothetical protein
MKKYIIQLLKNQQLFCYYLYHKNDWKKLAYKKDSMALVQNSKILYDKHCSLIK